MDQLHRRGDVLHIERVLFWNKKQGSVAMPLGLAHNTLIWGSGFRSLVTPTSTQAKDGEHTSSGSGVIHSKLGVATASMTRVSVAEQPMLSATSHHT